MSGTGKTADRYKEIRNRKARHKYFVGQAYEAGIILTGTEVKSIRAGKAQINEAFARVEKGKVILYHAHIAEYSFGSANNHNPYRPRQLLLHKKEIRQIEMAMQSGGKALIPTRMYFKKALIKIEIALCTGKQKRDKREDLKKRAALMDARRDMKIGGRR